MIRRSIPLACLLLSLATAAHAGHALRVNAAVGGAFASLSSQVSAPKAAAGFVSATLPVRPGLRAGVEVAYAQYQPNPQLVTVPEVRVLRWQDTGVLAVSGGIEWQVPTPGVWGAFLHASTGFANVAEGESFWNDMNSGPFTVHGEHRNVSMTTLGLGVRQDPERHPGPGLFADARVSYTAEAARQRLGLFQLLAGVTY